MRKSFLLITAALALAGASSAGADEGVVASASGGYSFSGPVLGGFIDVHPFAWNVSVGADGTVHGRYNYTQVRDGVELTVKGSLTYEDKGAAVKIKSTAITSFLVTGNVAEFSGTCNPDCTFTVRVVDGGEPPNDTFEITIVGPFGTYTASGPLQGGNIQVSS